jgi:hypothetical protein
MDSLMIGVPCYGQQEPRWWSSLATLAATLSQQGVAYRGLLATASMLTDKNRNVIVDSFLRQGAEWLLWLDADTLMPAGGVRRLLDTGKELVSGLYFSRNHPHKPVAYVRQADGRYREINGWVRGEIVAVDAAGMGCCLVHRCVYGQIKDQYVALQRHTGGLTAVHRQDILGDIPAMRAEGDMDGKVVEGVLQERVTLPTEPEPFPFYGLEYNRTEDLWFYELARRVGVQAWVDSGVECGHLRQQTVGGAEYRQENDPLVRQVVYALPGLVEGVQVVGWEADGDDS